ncbi:unnamed protein product, partial [Iphiclides podalirius]
MASQYGVGYREMALGEYSSNDSNNHYEEHEWNLALAFFYSLTVLTTIGYGNIAPRTILGKSVTILYAIIGIPLTLVYLSSVGSLLSKMARIDTNLEFPPPPPEEEIVAIVTKKEPQGSFGNMVAYNALPEMLDHVNN